MSSYWIWVVAILILPMIARGQYVSREKFTQFKDLEKLYPETPQERNAALFYLKAFEHIKYDRKLRDKLPWWGAGKVPGVSDKISDKTVKMMETVIR